MKTYQQQLQELLWPETYMFEKLVLERALANFMANPSSHNLTMWNARVEEFFEFYIDAIEELKLLAAKEAKLHPATQAALSETRQELKDCINKLYHIAAHEGKVGEAVKLTKRIHGLAIKINNFCT